MLVDCRHEPQPIDLDFMQYLGEQQIPFSIVFTKADKLKPKALERNIEAYRQRLLQDWEEMPHYFVTSSSNSDGREDLLDYIDRINEELGGELPDM